MLSRLFVGRGIVDNKELDNSLTNLLPPDSFKGMSAAVSILQDALIDQQRILIIGDFDATCEVTSMFKRYSSVAPLTLILLAIPLAAPLHAKPIIKTPADFPVLGELEPRPARNGFATIPMTNAASCSRVRSPLPTKAAMPKHLPRAMSSSFHAVSTAFGK